jgi:hypothetical protein
MMLAASRNPQLLCLVALATALGCGGGETASGPASDASTIQGEAAPPETGVLATDAGTEEAAVPSGDAAPDAGDVPDAALPSTCVPPFSFTDPVVETAVRAAAKIPTGPLSAANLLAVTEVDATGASSLGGVECLVNLQIANFTSGTIHDISAFSGLKSLYYVVLTSNQVSDLSPLTDHPKMKKIRAQGNQVADIDGLTLPASMCSVLDLSGNPIPGSALTGVCALGWDVTWGGTGTTPAGGCNAPCP